MKLRTLNLSHKNAGGGIMQDRRGDRDRLTSDMNAFAAAGGVVEVLVTIPPHWKGRDPRPASAQRGARLRVQ